MLKTVVPLNIFVETMMHFIFQDSLMTQVINLGYKPLWEHSFEMFLIKCPVFLL